MSLGKTFAEAFCAAELNARQERAAGGNATWTNHLSSTLVGLTRADQPFADYYLTTKARQEPSDPAEYLTLDAMFLSKGYHEHPNGWTYPPPEITVEFENLPSKIQFDYWKLLCVRSKLRVLIFVLPEAAPGDEEMLLERLGQMRLDHGEISGEDLLLVGKFDMALGGEPFRVMSWTGASFAAANTVRLGGSAPRMKLYGENAFTFLVFDALRRHDKLHVLFDNLKSFCDGVPLKRRTDTAISVENAQVWLFPCFGKREGYGEPDALVIVGHRAFWFEVETRIVVPAPTEQHVEAPGAAPLRQLYRFWRLAEALRGCKPMRAEQAVVGHTIRGDNTARKARWKVSRSFLKHGGKALDDVTEHHLVLLTDEKPRTDGGSWQESLSAFAETCFGTWDEKIARESGNAAPPPGERLGRCWYVYYRGDLSRYLQHLNLLDAYVEIKRR